MRIFGLVFWVAVLGVDAVDDAHGTLRMSSMRPLVQQTADA